MTLVLSIKLTNILTKQYSYLQKGDHTSNLVASEWFGDNNVIMDSLKYSYDMYGNIVAIKENGVEIVRYAYDEISRLIRKDNKKLNKTCTYSYDKGGNILERVEYAYSKLSRDKLTGGVRFTYVYPVSGWKDQLVNYNGENFIYDGFAAVNGVIGAILGAKVGAQHGLTNQTKSLQNSLKNINIKITNGGYSIRGGKGALNLVGYQLKKAMAILKLQSFNNLILGFLTSNLTQEEIFKHIVNSIF